MALTDTIAALAAVKGNIRAAITDKHADPGTHFADYAGIIKTYWPAELDFADGMAFQAIVSGGPASFMFSQSDANGVEIDWGDGSAVETSATAGEKVTLTHTYAAPGARHKIRVALVSGTATIGDPDNMYYYGASYKALGTDCAVYELMLSKSFSYGRSAFYGYTDLERLILSLDGYGRWAIPDYCFSYCTGLRHLGANAENNLPVIESVGYEAFYSCPLYGETPHVESRILRDAFRSSGIEEFAAGELLELGQGAFENCGHLRSFVVPHSGGTVLGSITQIPWKCFSDCELLHGVSIPDSVTGIDTDAFKNCISLEAVGLPAGVTSIAQQAFYRCFSLEKVALKATTPPTLAADTFDGCYSLTRIEVPSASLAAYQAATNWSQYASIMVGV